MKMRLSILVVAAVLLSFVPAPKTPVVHGQDGITFWLTGDDTGAAILQEVADKWTETSGVPVTVTAVGWGDAYAQSLAAVADGSGPDIISGGMSWGISLGSLGGMVDLGERYPEEIAHIAEISNPAFYNAILTTEGNVYYIPYNLDIMLMYYRTTTFEEAGLAAPATWEDVAAAADAGLKGGWSWGNTSWIGFQGILKEAGADWYTEDCSAAAIDSDEGLAALEFYTALYEDYGFPAEQVNIADGFEAGALDYAFSGEWEATGINVAHPDLEGTWSAAPVPAGPTGSFNAFIGGKGMGIFSYSENVDAAFEFMMYLSTREAQEMLTELSISNANSIHVPPQVENYDLIKGGDDVQAAIATQLTDASGPPICPGWEESNADVDLVLQSVLFEEKDFEDALAEISDILNAGIEEYGG
ncbi:MAG: extracellular solute-binding protein [Anaerolineae bacterium]|nr:extracellular solute-binding protein [Anaerolineae bacterium]